MLLTDLAAPAYDEAERCGACGQPLGYWTRDHLTGLADRWGWDLQAPPKHYEAMLRGEPVAVLIVDLDHFKWVNDEYGHVAGDAVLKATSRTLRKAIGRGSLISRYGGDEFLALVSGLDPASAGELADRVSDGIRKMVVETQATPTWLVTIRKLTASIGVAVQVTPTETSLHTLVLHADTALREAKRHGRDRTDLVITGTHAHR
jgi:diguanylate cyclase (GGDEF)-like protein